MSDYELISCPSSPRSTCSSASRHSCAAGRSLSGSTATGLTSACAIAEPCAEEHGHQVSIQPRIRQQQRSMTSFQPKLSMRPISTPINLLVCGASGSGKSSFIRAFSKMLNQVDAATPQGRGAEAGKPKEVSGTGSAADPAAVLARADEYSTTIGPIAVPEAGRELLYKLQDCPGYGATLDPAAYLEALLTYIFEQQEKDYKQLEGSRGMPKSLACGSLAHSVTACVYFLPPHGPSKLDLVLMSGLSRHVALLPVVGKADAMTADEAAACITAIEELMARPAESVPGLLPILPFRPGDCQVPLLLHTRSAKAAAPGTAAGAGCAGFSKLTELLTGDEVYGLLDNAWELYTSFGRTYEAFGKTLPTLASSACAAAAKAVPGTAALNEQMSKMTERYATDTRILSSHLADAREQLECEMGIVDGLQVRLEIEKGKSAEEAQLMDDLWDLLKSIKAAADTLKSHGSTYSEAALRPGMPYALFSHIRHTHEGPANMRAFNDCYNGGCKKKQQSAGRALKVPAALEKRLPGLTSMLGLE